ncbi:hypothetical protein ACWDKQ_33480 [Saccharopolyspora sp. NPDC000995]
MTATPISVPTPPLGRGVLDGGWRTPVLNVDPEFAEVFGATLWPVPMLPCLDTPHLSKVLAVALPRVMGKHVLRHEGDNYLFIDDQNNQARFVIVWTGRRTETWSAQIGPHRLAGDVRLVLESWNRGGRQLSDWVLPPEVAAQLSTAEVVGEPTADLP